MNTKKSGPLQQPSVSRSVVAQANLKSSPIELTSDEVSCLAKGGKDAALIAEKFTLHSAKTSVSQHIATNVAYQSGKNAPIQHLPENMSEVVSSDTITRTIKQRPQVSLSALKEVTKKKATKKKGTSKKK